MQPSVLNPGQPAGGLPDHTQLPEQDGTVPNNSQEHPQSSLLTSSIRPRLHQLHADGQLYVGQDSFIYWRYTQPVLAGCKAPDWFYVPGVPPLLNGQRRRSYVLWQEGIRPLVVIEYVSGDGSEERDTTPYQGKFWVYERGICVPYYAIFDAEHGTVDLHKLSGGIYQRVEPNPAGRLPIEPLGVELGIWRGRYWDMDLPWLRFWDAATGEMLPSDEERAEAERLRAEAERQRAETAESLVDDTRRRLEEECERAESERRRAEDERQKKDRLAERLRSLGIDPDAV
jgi:Uma2 family endonuclease